MQCSKGKHSTLNYTHILLHIPTTSICCLLLLILHWEDISVECNRPVWYLTPGEWEQYHCEEIRSLDARLPTNMTRYKAKLQATNNYIIAYNNILLSYEYQLENIQYVNLSLLHQCLVQLNAKFFFQIWHDLRSGIYEPIIT